MLLPRLAKISAASLLLCAAVFSAAQQSIVGQPTKGSVGVKATTKQIMQWFELEHSLRVTVYKHKKDREMWDMQPNPDGLDTPQFPPKPGLIQSNSLPTPKFSLSTSFDGAGMSDTIPAGFITTPPDSQGDVSPSSVLVVINGWVKSFNRAGAVGALNVQQETFFNAVRGGAGTGDARVRYDRLTGKWIVTAFTAPNGLINNRIVIAVSDGEAITASTVWTFFFFQHNTVSPAGNTGDFFDYPTLGVDSQALYIGGNNFTNGSSFSGTTGFVVRKSSITGGGPIVVTAFRNLFNMSNGQGLLTPQGVDNDDENSTDGHFIGLDGFSRIQIRRVTSPGGTPVLQALQQVSNVPSFAAPLSVPAQGSAVNLDSLGTRLLVAKIHHNTLTGGKTLWTAHSVGVNAAGGTSSPNRTATRWYEIENFTAAPTVRQAGTVFDSSASNPRNYWMASPAMNRQGHALIGMSVAGAADRAGVAVADRLFSDALGTTNTPLIVQPGVGTYNISFGDNPRRWGDYSHSIIDPLDGMSIWTFQEYCNENDRYKVRVVKMLAPPPATPVTVSPNNPQQGDIVTLTVTGTSSNGSGFFDPGAGFVNHIAASFSGSGVNVAETRFISPTSVEVDIVVANGASLGTRNLTITNPDGQTATLNGAITITSGAPALSSVALPATTASGATVQGTVTLTKPAQAGGATVTLSSSSSTLTVPASVTVAQGNTTANFNATAQVVNSPITVQVTATFLGVDKTAQTEVRAAELTAFSMNRTTIVGGSASTGVAKVTLSQPAPAGHLFIPVTASSGLISLPATIKVAAGKTTGQVVFSAPTAVNTANVVTVTATWQGVSQAKDITVLPPTPSKLLFAPAVFVGGSATVVTGTVTLSQVAPAGGVVVTLDCISPLLTVPATVTVPAGSNEGTFTIGHKTAPTQKIISIGASSGNVRKATKVTLNPPVISTLTADPKSLVGGVGAALTGTVTLNAPAATGGQDVQLTVSSGELVLSTAVLHFNQTQTSKTFTMTAPSSVPNNVGVTVSATLGGTKTMLITVTAPKVSSVSVSPNSVVGGSGATVNFTVNLTAPAPAGGYIVNLSSNNAAAGLPATVTIPAGSTSRTVAVSHSAVGVSTAVTLTASVNGSTKSTILTVNP